MVEKLNQISIFGFTSYQNKRRYGLNVSGREVHRLDVLQRVLHRTVRLVRHPERHQRQGHVRYQAAR